MRSTTTNARRFSALVLMAMLACPLTAWSQEKTDAASVDGTSTAAEQAASETAAAEAEAGAEAAAEEVDPLENQPGPPKPNKKKREYTAGEKTYDALVLRPWDFLGLCVSSVAFVPAALLTAPNGMYEVETALDVFVIEPSENVFERPLGRF